MCAAQNQGSINHPVGEKPLLRGKLHFYASFVALAGGIWLIYRSASLEAVTASIIYSLALTSLFAISALYHVPTWPTQTRLWLKRLDHSAIFILIAGTATPIFEVGLSGDMRTQALTLIWTGASLGILQSIFWTNAPKALVALLCVALGWLGAPYLLPLAPLVGIQGMWLLVSGGVVYSLGALVYALRKPDLKPGVFGYHELFHALVIVAAGLHYALIFSVITKSG
ncbi:MAG: hemolysin III family protein [Bdellovibrionia bacterium]